ncbi:MAG: hypothetical protein GY851_22890 [bacterium]|nr:hypothetical protein [bacterium]
MKHAVSIQLTGANVADTAKALATRLLDLGRMVERIDDAMAARFGGSDGANGVCGLLTRNGVVVLAMYAEAAPEGDVLATEIDANDTPDFAAEKILDELHEAGVVDLDTVEYSPEEEEQVRKRLADLGYVE